MLGGAAAAAAAASAAASSSSSSGLWQLLPPLWGGGFLVAFAQAAGFYYLLGALLHWVLPALLRPASIQEAPRRPGEVGRDALNSLGPLAVKAAVWTLVESWHAAGVSRLYSGPVLGGSSGGWWHVAYLVACVVVLDVLHDSWFYWTHRLLHWRPLYRAVHWEHHRSVAPSPFTGYAFHVGEAALVFANELLVCWLLPLHMGLHRLYHIFTTAIHQAGHAGYELSPFIPTVEGLAALLLSGLAGSRALNTVQHHDLHHRFPRRHFSLYFTHWDRWCGTIMPHYDTLVAAAAGGQGSSGSGSNGGKAAGAGGGAVDITAVAVLQGGGRDDEGRRSSIRQAALQPAAPPAKQQQVGAAAAAGAASPAS